MSDYTVHIQIEEQSAESLAELLREAAVVTLTHERVTAPASLSVVLSDDARLQALNKQFMGFDEPTDVLSFPDDDENDDYLGDIVISVARAQTQADAGGHPVGAELQLLTVHGVLHLLGYDHATPDERAAMWGVQAAVLTALKSAITGPALEQYE